VVFDESTRESESKRVQDEALFAGITDEDIDSLFN